MNKLDDTRITRSSGNVFADLGLENPDELKLKARLTQRVNQIITRRRWTQKKAAEALGIKQLDVSDLLRGKRLEHYSVERLMLFLGKLEQTVTITMSGDGLPAEHIVVSRVRAAPLDTQMR